MAWDGATFVIVFQDQKNRLALNTLDQLDARGDLFGMRVSAARAVVDPQGFLFSASPIGETDPTIVAADGVWMIAGSRDFEGTIATYAWDFGDGTISTDANPSHTYQTAWPYVVTLTVTDIYKYLYTFDAAGSVLSKSITK